MQQTTKDKMVKLLKQSLFGVVMTSICFGAAASAHALTVVYDRDGNPRYIGTPGPTIQHGNHRWDYSPQIIFRDGGLSNPVIKYREPRVHKRTNRDGKFGFRWKPIKYRAPHHR
ncbi:MAG: hypothetical protein EOM37_07460 [Proteobacteria bacterium]|jgi:hypothetical protein|nr:hypothetical protein [Alphaproteobacteria bacterium]NCC03867.1 hypothetical protein [Pseudomonadota bacterium]